MEIRIVKYIKNCILRVTVLLSIISSTFAEAQTCEPCPPPVPISIETMEVIRGKLSKFEIYWMTDFMTRIFSHTDCETSHTMYSIMISDYRSSPTLEELSDNLDMDIYDQKQLDIIQKILQYVFDFQLVHDSHTHGLVYDNLQKINQRLKFFGET